MQTHRSYVKGLGICSCLFHSQAPFLLCGGIPIPSPQAELSLHCFGPDQPGCSDCNSSPGRWGDQLVPVCPGLPGFKAESPMSQEPPQSQANQNSWSPWWQATSQTPLYQLGPVKAWTSRITHVPQCLQILTYLKHMNLESVFKAADWRCSLLLTMSVRSPFFPHFLVHSLFSSYSLQNWVLIWLRGPVPRFSDHSPRSGPPHPWLQREGGTQVPKLPPLLAYQGA